VVERTTVEDYEDLIIVKKMQSLLHLLGTNDRDFVDNADDLEEAARVLIEYYGIPHKDYTYE
jgi:hypothetical protein